MKIFSVKWISWSPTKSHHRVNHAFPGNNQPSKSTKNFHHHHYYCCYSMRVFISGLADGLHWNLSDTKFLQVYRTLLSILADLNNWMVSASPPIPVVLYLGIVPSAPITIGITVTFMFPGKIYIIIIIEAEYLLKWFQEHCNEILLINSTDVF